MVFVLYSGTIQLFAELGLKLIRLSAIISRYLAKYMKNNKWTTSFVHEIVIIFSPIYLSEVTYVISLFNLRAEL